MYFQVLIFYLPEVGTFLINTATFRGSTKLKCMVNIEEDHDVNWHVCRSLSGRYLMSTRVQTSSWHFGYLRVGRSLIVRRPSSSSSWVGTLENEAAAETLSTGKS